MPSTPDPLEIARSLVRIPSESSDPVGTYPNIVAGEAAAVEYLKNLAESAEIETETEDVLPGRPNLYLRIPRPNKPRIFFDNHLDTVSAANMEVDPFGGLVRDDKLWGRGSCDVKGGAGALTAAILEVAAKRELSRFDITVAFTVDEECSFAGARKVREKFSPFDFVICLEPTNFDIIAAHKGVYRFTITVKGTAAHSSTPELGENAIYKAMPIIDAVRDLAAEIAEENDPVLGNSTFSVNRIEGGVAFNIIAAQCLFEGDMRFLPQTPIAEFENKLRELCGAESELNVVLNAEGFANPSPSELELEFTKTHGKFDIWPRRKGAAFGTDCSKISSLGPCIVWGPGDIGLAHAKNENIPVNQLYLARDILTEFLLES